MKSTDKDLFACERQAHLYYENAAQVERDRIADRNTIARFEESERKKRVNEIFWHGVMRFITHMTLAIIVVYTLFHFA